MKNNDDVRNRNEEETMKIIELIRNNDDITRKILLATSLGFSMGLKCRANIEKSLKKPA